MIFLVKWKLKSFSACANFKEKWRSVCESFNDEIFELNDSKSPRQTTLFVGKQNYFHNKFTSRSWNYTRITFMTNQSVKRQTFTHLLKCVFRLRLSSIFGWSFPICSSSLDKVFVRFFFSAFWAWSLSCLLWRRLLKNMETLRSSTVPLVKEFALSMVSCFCCFSFSFVDGSPRFAWNLSLLRWERKKIEEKKVFSFEFRFFVVKQKAKERETLPLMPWKISFDFFY